MPRRKTAEATPETVAQPKKKPAAPRKPSAATHKRIASAKVKPLAPAEPMVPGKVAASSSPPLVKNRRAFDHIDIARRAYLYAEARGFQGGSPEEDWLRAERELLHLTA